ncbi:DUF4270 domain-containing protein [Capnocytophaga sp.]|uniref:DUF4270 domain-containing protein n=1 Tax=Capnocytophaga sp. TaxID=44737 RepID=UPI0026DB7DF5|nr:DUF4270 domain-containing protein [Capnocytophaga sp.]MDO5106310.1 DUF4270 domain-containing protein [Capnocytophaga sp.]
MNKIKGLGTLAIMALALQSCADDSFKEIKSDLLGNPNYEVGVYTATVSVTNIQEKAVQTNGLGGYLLGRYTQAPFGTKKANIIAQVTLPEQNPIFGVNAQTKENTDNVQENETVTEAYLYIPFFNPSSASNNASYVSEAEYRLDSIYGDQKASFKLSVNELTYFLRDVDNQLNSQVYYSDFDPTTHLGAAVVSPTSHTISNKSITRKKLDNPRTTEDESTTNEDVLAPGIRIPLNASFFQDKIFNKEGSDELANATVFKNYFRGISIVASDFSQDLMMLLDMAKAKIQFVYTYDVKENDKVLKIPTRYNLNLNGITVNLFENSNESVTPSTDAGNVSRVFLSGTQGYSAQFNLFTDSQLAEIKAKDVLITDASLFLYVDQSISYMSEPERIYVYNTKTGNVLLDYTNDPTATASTAATSVLNHLGKLHKENGKGVYYQIRLTNHIIDIIKKNAENVPIGVVIASNVRSLSLVNYVNTANEQKKIPLATVQTPLSTVIYGNSPDVDADKRLMLKINYTKSK